MRLFTFDVLSGDYHVEIMGYDWFVGEEGQNLNNNKFLFLPLENMLGKEITIKCKIELNILKNNAQSPTKLDTYFYIISKGIVIGVGIYNDTTSWGYDNLLKDYTLLPSNQAIGLEVNWAKATNVIAYVHSSLEPDNVLKINLKQIESGKFRNNDLNGPFLNKSFSLSNNAIKILDEKNDIVVKFTIDGFTFHEKLSRKVDLAEIGVGYFTDYDDPAPYSNTNGQNGDDCIFPNIVATEKFALGIYDNLLDTGWIGNFKYANRKCKKSYYASPTDNDENGIDSVDFGIWTGHGPAPTSASVSQNYIYEWATETGGLDKNNLYEIEWNEKIFPSNIWEDTNNGKVKLKFVNDIPKLPGTWGYNKIAKKVYVFTSDVSPNQHTIYFGKDQYDPTHQYVWKERTLHFHTSKHEDRTDVGFNPDHSKYPSELSQNEVIWGDNDLDWMIIFSCSFLNKEALKIANGVHVICGFSTVMNVRKEHYITLMNQLKKNKKSFYESWVDSCDVWQNAETKWSIIIGDGCENDHLPGFGEYYKGNPSSYKFYSDFSNPGYQPEEFLLRIKEKR